MNTRFPDEKLELGLPRRFDRWELSPSSKTVLLSKVTSAEGFGVLALGSLESQTASETKSIWDATLARATKEFGIRKIDARIAEALSSAPKVSMAIWLPIRIPTLKTNPVYDLALAI